MRMIGGDRDTNFFRDFSARDYGRLRRSISRGEVVLSQRHLEEMMQMYDGAVRRLDAKLRGLRRALKQMGLGDQTALFITADHGEEFLDHGDIGHGHSLHEEVIHVPLIGVVPGGTRGVRINRPVSHVDMADTLLAAAGIDVPGPSRNLLAPDGPARPVVSELRIGKRYIETLRLGKWKLHRRYALNDEGKAVDDQPPRCELYDLDTDPGEREDLAAMPTYADIVTRVGSELDAWRSAAVVPAGTADANHEVAIDDSVVHQLRALGYLD
jgi:arylsulfatase A-like enzyme